MSSLGSKHVLVRLSSSQVGGIYLIIHFVKSSKYDVITAAQAYEHDQDRPMLLWVQLMPTLLKLVFLTCAIV